MADWYLEASKTALEPSVMVWALETCLKLAHPFAPFVTEAIWQTLDWPARQARQAGSDVKDNALISSRWPSRTEYDVNQADEFEKATRLISEIREVLSVVGTSDIALISNESKLTDQFKELIIKLTKIGYIEQAEESDGLRLTSSTDNIWLDLSAEELQVYKSRIEKRLEDVEKSVHALEHRLSNKGYIANAPEALVEESRGELQQAQNQAEHLRHQLKHL
jgi:valyl-tRNA synthetase